MSSKIIHSVIQKKIEKNGYAVLKNFISKSLCKKLHDNVMNNIALIKDSAKFHQGASMVYNLQNKSEEFLKIIFNSKINKICNLYFKNGSYKNDKNVYQFDALHSRILYGKSTAQNLHIDSRICGVYPPTHLHFFLYLTKVEKNDGPTQIVSGSHKIKRYPKKKDSKKVKKILGDKGTVIVANSSVWHGSSEKNSLNPRAILTLSYSRWHLRQTFAVPYSLPKKIQKKLSKKQKIILGFFNYPPTTEKIRLRMRGKLTTLKAK
jgi:ectoine hydroxylase-related dioxygenase (phytanoyl-CoA dioxygenase family)